MGQHVLGDGQRNPADQPDPATRFHPGARIHPGAVPVDCTGPLHYARSRRMATEARNAGHREGLPGGGSHDDPPHGIRVACCDRSEAQGLGGGDWPDPAQKTGHAGDPGQYLPGHGHIQQPSGWPAPVTRR